MSEKIKEAYRQYSRVKLAALAGLIIDAILITVLAGGFPPWAWRFLVQTIFQLPQLWRVEGPPLLLPFVGLCLLSLSLLILWVTIVGLMVKVVLHLWYDFQAKQKLQDELRVAEILAEHEFNAQEAAALAVAVAAPAASSAPRQTQWQPRPMQEVHKEYSMMQKVVGSLGGVDTIPSFPGLSYQTAPAAPLNYGYGTRPAVTRPVQVDEEETTLPGPIPLPSRPVSGVRHRLRIVPLQDKPDNNQDEPAGNVSTESEELEERDAADELFIGREEEPPRDSRPEEVLIEDLDDTVAEVDLPVVSPSELSTNSRRASFAIWGEDEDADENLVQQGSEDDSAMHLTVGLGTDPGIARKDAPNEDSLFAIQGMRITDQGSKPAGLFVIADGMGGHVNGREASRSAIHALTDVIVPTLLRDVSGNSAHEEETLFIDMLKDGVHRANLSLYRRNRDIQGMMGTTLTAALVVDTNAYIANVGDSRTYLYRADEGLRQITHDHSIVAQMVENGVITREDIYTHPRRNQIYRCLGEHASVEIDTFVVPLLPNDVLILCSDGLWEMVHDPDLEKIIASSAYSPGQLSTLLVQAALNNGGADNISVVVVRVADAAQNKNWLL